MNKTNIITSNSDIELDPESLTEPSETNLQEVKNKRLEAIKELEAMIDENESMLKDSFTVSNKKEMIDCCIKLQSKFTKNIFITNFNLTGLNQTVIERNITEIEINGDDQKLIQMFAFYQNNVYKQKKASKLNTNSRILLQKTNVSRRRKRNVLKKNDVVVTKLYAKLNKKIINLIDLEQYDWKVNEMKYTFDNNRSSIKMLLVRSK